MRRLCLSLFILSALLCFLCISCSTTKAEEVPVPVEIDLTDVIDPVLMQRPDNSTLVIHPGPIFELIDVVENSATYLYAWEMWEDYATLLEDTLISVKDNLKASR